MAFKSIAKAVLAVVLGATAWNFGVVTARAETVLALGHVLGDQSHYGAAATVLANEVARRTEGRFRVETYPRGSLGGEREMLVGIQVGTLDLLITSTGPLGDFAPESLIIDLPFLFRDKAHARAVLDGPIGQDILERFTPHGLIGLAWSENGFRHLTTTDRPVSAPTDLKGLTIRTMQNTVHQRAFSELGARPAPLPYPGLYAALKTHRVDGQENPLAVIVDGHLAEVQKYLSLTAHIYSPAVLVAAPRLWATLSDADRTAFRDAARLAAAAQRAAVDQLEQEGVAALRAAGMTIIDTVDRDAFRAALAPLYQDYEKTFGADHIARIRETAR